MDRAACLKRWRESSAAGTPIVGAGAGTGISAKCAEAAGADLIIIYNSGSFRYDRAWEQLQSGAERQSNRFVWYCGRE